MSEVTTTATTNLGRVSIVPKGDYDATVQYSRLDVVKYNRDSYLAKTSVIGVTPGTDATKWMLLVEGAMSVPEAEAIVDDLEDDVSQLKSANNQTDKGLLKYVFNAEETALTLQNTGYAINSAGTGLVAASGYNVYSCVVNTDICKSVFIDIPKYANYTNAIFALATGVTAGHISIAHNFDDIPTNCQRVYVTLADGDTLSKVYLLNAVNDEIKGKVNKNGTDEVTAENCQFIRYKNMFDKDTATLGKYVNQTNGNLDTNANFFASDYIRVKENTSYIYYNGSGYGHARYAVYNENNRYITGDLFTSTPLTIPTGGSYIRISDYIVRIDTAQLEEGTAPTEYTNHVLKIDAELLPAAQTDYINNGYVKKTGTLLNGQSLTGFVNNLKKNNVYVFMCKVSSLTELRIGHGTSQYESSYITITQTNADYTEMTPSEVTTQHQHGLTISDFLNVMIAVKDSTADVRICTSSGEYSFTTQWDGSSNSAPYVTCVSGNLADCEFTWCSGDFVKNLWYFGDSYINYKYSDRWTYYLKQNNWLKNILLNGFGGEGSANAYTAFMNTLGNGKPEAVIWALGMNDGSDTDENTPSAVWKTNIDNFINVCSSNDIVPILATIPSVPNISHEGKNAYVRNSGYRYIDFADAVGANSSGVWYTGMLSSDNVHPTAKGALALFNKAIADVPELTYD